MCAGMPKNLFNLVLVTFCGLGILEQTSELNYQQTVKHEGVWRLFRFFGFQTTTQRQLLRVPCTGRAAPSSRRRYDTTVVETTLNT